MRPKPPVTHAPDDLFRQRLTAIIDAPHPLVKLPARIDWAALGARFADRFVAERGRPALPVRPMEGLHLLGQIRNLSDEAVCAAWLENPYFQHALHADRSSISRWRSRVQEADSAGVRALGLGVQAGLACRWSCLCGPTELPIAG